MKIKKDQDSYCLKYLMITLKDFGTNQ
jgi:hypothetical protein